MASRIHGGATSVSRTNISGRFDAFTAWTVGAGMTTFWGVVIGIIVSFLAPIPAWATNNHHWLVPTLVALLVVGPFLLGVFITLILTRSMTDRGETDARPRQGHYGHRHC